VEYGLTAAYGSLTTRDPALVTRHSQTLAGLSPNTLYRYRIHSRAADGTLAAAGELTFTTAACPCTLWGGETPTAQQFDNGTSIELGVQFRPDLDGYVTGLRFYKADGDPGAHVGNLWTAAGASLASAAFAAESAGGWQQVTFAAPVPVTAGTTYVASYNSGSGRYVASPGYFVDAVQRGPLRAPATAEAGARNGVFTVGAGFPTGAYNGTNYWVDVVFTTSVDTTPPDTAITSGPANPSGSADAVLAFSASEAGGVFACSLDGAAFAACTSPVSHTGLAEGRHTFVVVATDPAGNTDDSPASAAWTVDTTAPTVAITAPANGGVSASAGLALAAEATDGAGSGLAAVQFQRSSDGGATYRDEGAPIASPPYSVTVGALADGVHSVRAIAADQAGNRTASAAVTFTVDTVAPAAPSAPDLVATDDSGRSNTDNITNRSVLTFTGLAEAASTVELFRGTASLATATADGSGAWRVTGGVMADGLHSITARATDPAGNTGPASAALDVTIDASRPVPGGVQASAITDRTVVIGWTTDEPADAAVEYGTTTAYGMLKTGGAGLASKHSQQLTGLLPSTLYHYRVNGQDAAGNLATSADLTFTTGPDAPPVVVATLAVGDTPRAVAANPTTGRVYVANEVGNSLSVIDGPTNRVVATVPVGATPRGVAVNPSTGRVYATNYGSNSVSVLDDATGAAVATVPVGVGPRGVAVNPTTGRVYVANAGSDNVSVIDAPTNRVVATVPVGTTPRGVAVDPTTNRVYVSDYDQGSLWVIDGSTDGVITTVAVGSRPRGVSVNPTTNRIYVANEGGTTVSVLDGATNTVIATVAVGSEPWDVGVNPTTNRIYVANSGPNTVSVLDGVTNTVVATVAVGTDPWGLAIDTVTERVYVANRLSDSVSVIQD
jgi:YVTN family beta-propeller protein